MQQNQARPDSAAFSILEILIVISIMMVVFAILFTSIANYSSRQTFKTTLIDIRDGITEIRSKTLASIDDSIYGVHVSSTAVVLFSGQDFTEGDPDNITFSLPNSITATSAFSGNVTTATFTRLTGKPSATGTIVLEDSVNNNVATITISTTGLVE